MTASHAARLRERNSVAATIAIEIAANTLPSPRGAVKAMSMTTGAPMAARCGIARPYRDMGQYAR